MKEQSRPWIKGLGVVDFTKPLTLGNILIFIENMKIKQMLRPVAGLDICFIVGDNSKEKISKKIVPVIGNYLDVTSYNFFDSWESIEKKISVRDYTFVYPTPEEYLREECLLDSTKEAMSCYKSNGSIPTLTSKIDNIRKNKEFLEKWCPGKVSVAVHLKNNIGANNESNANQEEWFHFFKYCQDHALPACFILIGDDIVSKKIKALPNVRSSRNEAKTGELNLLNDLILIEIADMYMGMCSGPFQIALFNRSPYLVFKNPQHHREEMAKEIGDMDHYIFSAKNQRIFREYETKEKLIGEFLKVFSSLLASKNSKMPRTC